MKTHENQITDYPKGARIEAIREIPLCSPTQNYYADPLPQGTRGTVTAHTDDGRAWINFDGQGQGLLGHTFEQPEKYIRVVCTHRDDNCPANHDQISSTSDDAPAAPERGDDGGVNRYLKSEIKHLLEENATLIAQRERLLAAIRKFVDYYDGANAARLGNGQARRSLDEFREVITTSEQEGRR